MSTQRKVILAFLAILLVVVLGFAAFTFLLKADPTPPIPSSADQAASHEAEAEKTPLPSAFARQTIAEGLIVPWELVFTDENRMLVTERPGRVRQIVDGKLAAEPVYTFSEAAASGEEGLMGMALDPDYASNRRVYFSLAYQGGASVKVVSLRDAGDRLEDPKTLLDNIPAAQFHAGSRIKFGPDHKLYVTTGDATNKSLPQNKKSLGGKILRLNTDGTVPVDNPEEGSFIYSYGHRNPQGLAWDPKSGELYGTEHGPSGSDGPPGGDEVNHIVPGGNYGWPLVSHNDKYAGTEEPLRTFTPAIAPSGAMFYAGTLFPGLTGKLLFTGLIGEGLFTATIDAENPDHMYDTTKLSGIDVGRIRDVVEGPDGALYLLTSNRDSRGDVREGDDKVIRLTPGQ